MLAFDLQLLRLKQALRVSEDQDVAEALGMTKAAFSARKARGVFPEEKVKVLATDRPELRLDVRYILTGQSDELERRLAAIGTATRISEKVADKKTRREIQQAVFDILVGELSPDEQKMVQYFRVVDDHGKAKLLATGIALASDAMSARKATQK